MNNIPQRTCISCRNKKNKNEFLKIVMNKNKEVFIDLDGKKEGRGAYICKEIECIENVIQRKWLNNACKSELDNKIYDLLRGVVIE